MSADFVINATMDKIRFTEQHEFSDGSLKLIYARISGNFNSEAKLIGKGFVKLDGSSKAWQDIKERGWEEGIKLTGLSPDNKIGKFPLAGLAWSLGFFSGGYVSLPRQTQPALNQGHFVADGNISLDGTARTRVVLLNSH